MKRVYTFFFLCLTLSFWYNIANAQTVNIPDSNLAAAVREALDLDRNDRILQRDMQTLTYLDAKNRNIKNLIGLEHATELRGLELRDNQIRNIRPLANLKKLESLGLENNPVGDITPLANMTQLTWLIFGGSNRIADFTPLSNLKRLEALSIWGQNIKEISFLVNLTALTKLWIGYNKINDISPLENLTQLEFLYLENNQIKDIAPLGGLTNLQTLALQGNQIQDVSPLAGLINLTTLYLKENPIQDHSPLASLTTLHELDIEIPRNGFVQGSTQSGLPEGAKARIGKGKAYAIAFSPDGSQLAVGTSIGIWIYDANTGVETAFLTRNRSPVTAIAYSPDGRRLAGANYKEVHLWDTRTSQFLTTFTYHTNLSDDALYNHYGHYPLNLEYSPNNRFLAVANRNNIRLLDTRTGEFKVIASTRYLISTNSIAFSPDGRTIAYGISNLKRDVTVHLQDINSGEILSGRSFYGTTSISLIQFTPDGREMIVGRRQSSGNFLNKFTLDDKHRLSSNGQHGRGEFIPIAYSADGRVLISEGHLNNHRLYISNGQNFWNIKLGGGAVTRDRDCNYNSGSKWFNSVSSAAISPDSRIIATEYDDGAIYLWNTQTRRHTFTIYGHLDIKSVAYSPDNNTLFTESRDGIYSWNPHTGQYNTELVDICEGDNFDATAQSQYGNIFATKGDYYSTEGSRYREINLLDTRAAGWARRRLRSEGVVSVDSLVFSSNGNILASIGGIQRMISGFWHLLNNRQIHFWDVSTGKVRATLTSPDSVTFTSVALSSNGYRYAIGRSDGQIELWKGRMRQRIFRGHTEDVTSLAFSPNADILASGSADGTIQLWNLSITSRISKVLLNKHTAAVNSLAFSPSGDVLASGSADSTIRLWDPKSGKLERTLDGSLTDVTFVMFSPDRNTLATGSRDGTVLLWELLSPTQVLIPGLPMYWINAEAGTLHRLVGAEVENLVPSVQKATGLVLNSADNKIYWTEQMGKNRGRVKRANLDGSNVKVLANIKSGVPHSIAVDPAQGKFYWTDSRGRIQRSNLNGKQIRNLVRNLKSPENILVNTAEGKLYWTEASGRIQCADLNGNSIQNIVSGLGMLSGITISGNYLYWTEITGENSGKIGRANLNGSNLRTLVTLQSVPSNITVDHVGNKLYWTDTGGNIKRANLNGKNIQKVVSDLPSLADFALGSSNLTAAAAPANSSLISSETPMPDQTGLLTNYPNPFNPETWIPYHLAKTSDVKITICDTRGVVVRKLELGHQPPGYYTSRVRAAYWDGRNDVGEKVSSGIYFYTLTAGDFSTTKKMLIRK